jgi:Zn-dependent M16 (insulinase) family peptidase
LVESRNRVVNVTLDGTHWAAVEPQLAAFLRDLPAASVQPTRWAPLLRSQDEGLAISAQVNYVGKGGNLYSLGYTYHGSIHVINNFIRTSWLWDKVRAEGGAYGAFVSFGKQSGLYTFLSYRDPNLAKTLNVYDQTAALLRQLELSPDELTKNVIGAVGDIDAYQLPDAKGRSSLIRFLIGETEERRQQMRDEVLSTTLHHFRQFGDVLATFNQQAHVVVMGAADVLTRHQERPLKQLDVL